MMMFSFMTTIPTNLLKDRYNYHSLEKNTCSRLSIEKQKLPINRTFPLSNACLTNVYLVLCSKDPFADATKGDDRLPGGTEDYIHIRIQQRNGRKTLTTVQGIADGYDKKKLVKAFKKVSVILRVILCFMAWMRRAFNILHCIFRNLPAMGL